jgi:predicted HicB family RNase H-like nuclease
MKLVNRYTYRVTWSDEDQEFVGLCAEFPSLSWLDKQQTEALNGIVRVVGEVLEDMESSGEKPPVPLVDREYSGELRLRMPPGLHQRLAIRAAEEKTSINRLIIEQLTT